MQVIITFGILLLVQIAHFATVRQATVICNSPPTHPENGKVSFVLVSRVPIWIFKCDKGYFLEGYRRLRCKGDGSLTRNPPKCVKRSCDIIANSSNLVPSKLKLMPGESVLFKCINGARIVGSHKAKCTKSGTLDQPIPSCDIECPVGKPRSNCPVAPCSLTFCVNYPEAICVNNYCGGCKAEFRKQDGTNYDC